MLRKSILAVFLLCCVALSAHAESGIASVYRPSDPDGGGPLAANGEQINTGALIAAHKSLPFGTLVRVTNTRNGCGTNSSMTRSFTPCETPRSSLRVGGVNTAASTSMPRLPAAAYLHQRRDRRRSRGAGSTIGY